MLKSKLVDYEGQLRSKKSSSKTQGLNIISEKSKMPTVADILERVRTDLNRIQSHFDRTIQPLFHTTANIILHEIGDDLAEIYRNYQNLEDDNSRLEEYIDRSHQRIQELDDQLNLQTDRANLKMNRANNAEIYAENLQVQLNQAQVDLHNQDQEIRR